MKKLYLLLLTLSCTLAISQNKSSLYGFNSLPQSLLLNPSVNPTFDKHYGIPFLSQVHVNFGSSGVDAYDVFKDDPSTTINQRINDIILRLEDDDYVELNSQLELISVGWRSKTKNTYYSGGLYLEVDNVTYIPDDLAELLYEGNRNNLNRTFSLDEVVTSGDAVATWHFGISKQINKKTRFGFRGKLYSSLVHVKSTDNEGQFITTERPEGPNLIRNSLLNTNILVRTSGLGELISLPEGSQPSDVMRIFRNRIFFGGSLGLGVDLGFTHQLREDLTLSASIVDLGFIVQSNDVETYTLTGSYDFDGLEQDFPDDDEANVPPYYSDFEQVIEEELPFSTLNDTYTLLRPTKFFASLSHGFNTVSDSCDCYGFKRNNEYDNIVGFQTFAVKRPKHLSAAATLFYEKRLAQWLRGKLSYTVDSFSYYNVGALLSVRAGNFNFYLAADNLLEYQNLAKANSLSLQLGFQILLNNKF